MQPSFPGRASALPAEWSSIREYRQIRQELSATYLGGAVNVESESPVNQVEALRRQIEELQRK